MNDRILDLIKHPNNIQKQDINLLETELKTHPYIQSIRALHLLATSEFLPENYKTELSKTAAYTTDKKILYHFINKLEQVEVEDNSVLINENIDNEETNSLIDNKIEEEIQVEIKKKDSTILTNENIDNEETNSLIKNKIEEEIQVEAEAKVEKKDSSILINENIDNEETNDLIENKIEEETEIEVEAKVETEDSPILTNENTDNEETNDLIENKIEEETEIEVEAKVETEDNSISINENIDNEQTNDLIENEIEERNNEELSFHNTDSFLPNITPVSKVSTPKENYIPPKTTNKHEEEMKRLIAEVEAKIKAKKEQQRTENKTIQITDNQYIKSNSKISFAKTQSFDFNEKPKPQEPEKTIETEPIPTEQKSTWKPMSVVTQKTDASISLTEEKPKSETSIAVSEEKTEQERPVFNVSFFAQNVSKIEPETDTKTEKEEPATEESNVPKFINTWQNWLNFGKKDEQTKEEIKEKAIEKFIENEPKISKLKEETEFVLKEKNNDISHLMTETLANLYATQKLYTKAIKAYEILTKKHPEKAEIFATRIEEIKQQRAGK
ncbi:MAG: hypothetical protein Q4G16_05800 [Cruoricaptor ignavus]|nr:hypothetical protein [Cruoricaptor ignavus]